MKGSYCWIIDNSLLFNEIVVDIDNELASAICYLVYFQKTSYTFICSYLVILILEFSFVLIHRSISQIRWW